MSKFCSFELKQNFFPGKIVYFVDIYCLKITVLLEAFLLLIVQILKGSVLHFCYIYLVLPTKLQSIHFDYH